ncbi:MAG: hypothetical protein GF311_04435 [Candidatus Lokiarchaeota archaeon]|nr:hypothetical protein [Candidatus Lokiarchaeota archaeon]
MGKIKEFLNKNFYKIFNDSHIFYTIIFFISALFVALLSLVPLTNVGNVVLFLSTSISLTFILLMFIALIPALREFLFSEEKRFDRNKIIGFLGTYLISFIITLIYFLLGSSTNLTVEFFGWDVLLPILFIVIFFGWNLLQILFLRSGIETLSEKIEKKILPDYESLDKKEKISLIIMICAVIIPILLQIALLVFFNPLFSSLGGEMYTWFILISVVMFIIIAITSWRLIILYMKSTANNTPNIFSPFFFIFIWLYLSYRTFSFLNSLQGAGNVGADIFTAFMDILLMILTAILVLRSLGGKLFGATIFNEDNMPFFLYAFTMLYIQGQIIMITGAGNLIGVFSDQNQVDMVNNFLIIIITVGFYLWYSSFMLQRKGLIERTLFTREEIIEILKNYREHLDNLGYIKKQDLGKAELKTFLEKQKISSEEIFEKPSQSEKESDTSKKPMQPPSEEAGTDESSPNEENLDV